MPAIPPFMKGSAARITGVWRKSVVARFGFSVADFMIASASCNDPFAEVSAEVDCCFASSTMAVAGIVEESSGRERWKWR